MSFLSVFKKIADATLAASRIAAPIVQAVDPEIGLLLTGATNAAVGVEAAITTPGSGAQKNQIVKASTQATVDVANEILISQGKQPLPANITDATMASLEMVLQNLNAVQQIAQAKVAPIQNATPAPSPVVIQQP